MKNKVIKIFLTLALLAFISCNKKNNYAIFLPSNDTIKVKSINWVHNESKPGKFITDFYIELDNYSKVNDLVKPNIKIKLGENFYTAGGVRQTFGRDIYDTDLIYFYKKDTGKIVIDTIDGKKMILFWPEKPRHYNFPKNLKIRNIYK
jgi:hypothetical protein